MAKIEEYICMSNKELPDNALRELYKKLNCTVVVEGQVDGTEEWHYVMKRKYDPKDDAILSQFGLEKVID